MLGFLVGLACLSGPALAQPAAGLSDDAKLARVITLYETGKYGDCVKAFSGLIGAEPRQISDPDVLERARMYYAACLIGNGQTADAEEQMRAALRQNPQVRPDSLVFPGPVIDRFLQVKDALKAELAEAEAKKREAARAAAAAAAARTAAEKRRVARLEELASQEVQVEKNSRWVAAIPFGAGQFQNRDPLLGYLFLGSEVLLAGTAIGAMVIQLDLNARADDDPPPEPVAKPKPRPDAGAPDAGPADAGTSIGDPVAMAGGAGKIVDANANVRLIVFNDRIRNHPLGARIGTLLGGAEQWKDFFGPTGLDPIKDVDRILIAGPQLRKSADVVAVLRVNVPNDKLRAAVDALVQRDAQGGWLDAGVPAARLQADRAERLLVLPAPQILVMAPPSAEKHALSLGSGLKFPNPKGNEALTTFVVTPWRAFVGIPFEIPKSIKWVRMKITPTSDGGAVADLVAEDESPESAAKHAEELAAAIDKVTHPKVLGFQVVALLEPISLKPVGSEIHGSVVATPKQLARLLEAVSAYAKELAEEAARKAAAKAAKDGGAPGADSGASDGERPAKDGGARPSMADAGRD